jgi:hypothetical protein
LQLAFRFLLTLLCAISILILSHSLSHEGSRCYCETWCGPNLKSLFWWQPVADLLCESAARCLYRLSKSRIFLNSDRMHMPLRHPTPAQSCSRKTNPPPCTKNKRNRESGGWGFARSRRRGGENEDEENSISRSTDNRPVATVWCHTAYLCVAPEHVLMNCRNPQVMGVRAEAWEGKNPGSVRRLLADPRWEKRFVRFLELSGVGRTLADGTDEESAYAARMDTWRRRMRWKWNGQPPGVTASVSSRFYLYAFLSLSVCRGFSGPR